MANKRALFPSVGYPARLVARLFSGFFPLARLRSRALLIGCALIPSAICAAAEPPVQAKPADSFIDSIGANGVGGPYITRYGGERRTLYGTTPVDFKYLMGMRHSRYEIRPGMDAAPIANLYEDHGIQINALISWLWTDPRINKSANIADSLEMLKRFPAGSIATIEGNNEADMPQESGDFPRYASSMKAAVENQAALFKAVKANPQFKDIPVIAFTLGKNWPWGGRMGYGTFTSTSFDYESLHSYTAGDTIDGSLHAPGHNEWLKLAHSILPNGEQERPIVVTETGFVHRIVDKNKAEHNSEVAQAKQEMMLLAQNFSMGFVRTFLYSVGGEANWEMDTRKDGTPMPAGRALSFITGALGDAHWDTQRLAWVVPPMKTISLAYNIGNVPRSVHSLLLQKADGSLYVLVWNDVLVWDSSRNCDIHSEPVRASLSVASPVSGATISTISTMSDNGEYKTIDAKFDSADGRAIIPMSVPDSLMLIHITLGR
jgi:hypothetical protein